MLLDIVSKFNLDDHLVPENLVTHYLNKLFVDILIFMALMPRIFKWDPHDAMQTDDMSPVTQQDSFGLSRNRTAPALGVNITPRCVNMNAISMANFMLVIQMVLFSMRSMFDVLAKAVSATLGTNHHNTMSQLPSSVHLRRIANSQIRLSKWSSLSC